MGEFGEPDVPSTKTEAGSTELPATPERQGYVEVPINLNDYIAFEPTDLGHEIYRAYEYKSTPELIVDEKGWSRLQTWQFMEIFGKDIARDPIKDMNVRIERKLE